MQEETSMDVRRLLKTFGVKADQAVTAQMRKAGVRPLRIRLVLEDLTDYGTDAPAEKLHLSVEGDIRE